MARALEALPRRQREVAVLRYLLEMSTAEVAAALGIAEGTVKSSLARARAHLVEALAVHDAEVRTMSKVDDELTRRLQRAERPVDGDGVFEGLARRRSHRERVRRVQGRVVGVRGARGDRRRVRGSSRCLRDG